MARRKDTKPARIAWLPVPDESELPEEVQSLFAKAREKVGFVPNVFRVFAFRPEHLIKWRALYDELLRERRRPLHSQKDYLQAFVPRPLGHDWATSSLSSV